MPYVFFEEAAGNAAVWGEALPDKTVVSTYAQFGVWARRYPNFAANFDIIICDEAHNLVVFPTFGPQPNFASIARDAICEAVCGGQTLVVGITATPAPLENLNCPQNRVPIDTSVLRQYENGRVETYNSLRQVLENLPPNQRGALFVPHITQMKECEAIATAAGRTPICVWSLANTDHPMNEEQLAARRFILEKEEVPPQYDLFIFNASSETSINLRGHMDFFIVHSTNATSITQSRGRYRGDLDVLYVLNRTATVPVVVPQEFLDIRLFKDDQQQLRLRLDLKDAKGHYLPYNKQYERLEVSGYTIDTGRDNNKRYIISSKQDDP